MDAVEAVRILVEKVRPWVIHFPEWSAAIDALVAFVGDQAAPTEPERPAEPGFGVEIVNGGNLPDLPVGSIVARCESDTDRRVIGTPFTTTANGLAFGWYRVLYRAEVAPPAAPKVGDTVPDYGAAVKLPVGTTITSRDSDARGLVIEHPDALMRVVWTRGNRGVGRWPATIADLP